MKKHLPVLPLLLLLSLPAKAISSYSAQISKSNTTKSSQEIAFIDALLNSLQGQAALKKTCYQVWHTSETNTFIERGQCEKAKKEIEYAKDNFPELLKFVRDNQNTPMPGEGGLTYNNFDQVLARYVSAIDFISKCSGNEKTAERAAKTMEYWGTTKVGDWYYTNLKEMGADDAGLILDACKQGSWAESQSKYFDKMLVDAFDESYVTQYDPQKTTVVFPRLGIGLADLANRDGVSVVSIEESSPAKDAGMIAGSTILRVDNQILRRNETRKLIDIIRNSNGPVSLLVERDGREQLLTLLPTKKTVNFAHSKCLSANNDKAVSSSDEQAVIAQVNYNTILLRLFDAVKDREDHLRPLIGPDYYQKLSKTQNYIEGKIGLCKRMGESIAQQLALQEQKKRDLEAQKQRKLAETSRLKAIADAERRRVLEAARAADEAARRRNAQIKARQLERSRIMNSVDF